MSDTPSKEGAEKIEAKSRVRYPKLGQERAHVVLAARALRRPLAPGQEVHHVDGDGHNNAPSNLVICENHRFHHLLHLRAEALRVCGHAEWRRCYFCGRFDSPERLRVGAGGAAFHLACKSADQNARRRKCRI